MSGELFRLDPAKFTEAVNDLLGRMDGELEMTNDELMEETRASVMLPFVPVDAGALAERVVDQLLAKNRHHELRVCKSDGTSLAIWTWEDAVEDVKDILEAMNQ
jgi:hypothetical protein